MAMTYLKIAMFYEVLHSKFMNEKDQGSFHIFKIYFGGIMKLNAKLCSYPSNSCKNISKTISARFGSRGKAEASQKPQLFIRRPHQRHCICWKFSGDPLNSCQHVSLIVESQCDGGEEKLGLTRVFRIHLLGSMSVHSFMIAIFQPGKKVMGQIVIYFLKNDSTKLSRVNIFIGVSELPLQKAKLCSAFFQNS